jgi:hypothetical protein
MVASCPLLAHSGRPHRAGECPLLGVKRTSRRRVSTSAFDPKRKATHWAADVIETEFIQAAAAIGARVLSGGGMCVHQAVEAFRLFTGMEPDPARLHRTFAAALAAREKGMAKARLEWQSSNPAV